MTGVVPGHRDPSKDALMNGCSDLTFQRREFIAWPKTEDDGGHTGLT